MSDQEQINASSKLNQEDIKMITDLAEVVKISGDISQLAAKPEMIASLLLKIVHQMKFGQKISNETGENEKGFETAGIKEMKKDNERTKKRMRRQEDITDAIWQRQRKGNFKLISPDIPQKNLKSIFLSDDELKSQGLSIQEYSRQLILERYDVDIPAEDISACHKLADSSILVCIWNRKEGAAYWKLVEAVKTGGKKKSEKDSEKKVGKGDKISVNKNFFIYFHLTRRRNNIVKHLKSLKKQGKIHRFFTDHNGIIKFQQHPNSAKKVLTLRYEDESDGAKTYYYQEIDALLM